MAFTFVWTVRTGDTDFSGLIYTPTVIDQIVRGMERLFETIDFAPSDAGDRGILYPAVHVEANYRGSIGVDDRVTVELTPQVGAHSITLAAVGRLEETVVFDGELTLACVDRARMEPIRVPDDIREALAAYE